MICNADITLYNIVTVNGVTHYNKTYIYGVNFQTVNSIKNDRVRGIIGDDVVSVYVPFLSEFNGKEYIKPKEYKRMLREGNLDIGRYFTLDVKDKIVKGIIDFELTGEKDNNIAYLENYYDDVYDITTVATNDNGSLNMQHWRVGAK